MKKLIISEFKLSYRFLITVISIFSILYVALCLNTMNQLPHCETDNLDFILPVIILVVIIYNFRYLKVYNEYSSNLTLPIDSKKLFLLKYISSLLYIFIIVGALLIISFPAFFFSNKRVELAFSYLNFNYLFYFLSLFIKFIFIFLLFNFFLYFFIKGKSLLDGILYIVLSTIVMSLMCMFVFYVFNVEVQYYFVSIISPFNIFYLLTLYMTESIFNCVFDIEVSKYILYIIVFMIASSITALLLINKHKRLQIEELKTINKDKVYKITLLCLSIISIFLTSYIFSVYQITISIILLINLSFYLIYSNFELRFQPNKKEKIIYFTLFILSVIVPNYL